jgi:hypothetical protein
MVEDITYGDLFQILQSIGFVERSIPNSHVGYRHAQSDTLILLAPHTADEVAKPIDLKYVRRVLDEKGLLDGKEFDRRIIEAYSSHTA